MAAPPSTTTGPASPSQRRLSAATHGAQRATLLGILALLAVLAIGRLLVTAFSYGIPAWFDEELNPLLLLRVDGLPITSIDVRQYGVIVFLVFDPAVRVVGANLAALATYATWVGLAAAGLAFALVAWRFVDGPARGLVLLIVWASAVPLLYVIAQHMVDAWQLLFVSAALVLFTGSPRQRWLAGVPLAFATLTKLLPALLLVYLFVRSWRAGLVGIAAGGVLLLVGHAVYGPLMGLGYPLVMLSGGSDTVARWSMHFENNSVRGMVYKLASGFRLQGDTTTYVLEPGWYPALNVLAYALVLGLVVYLLYAAWHGRGVDSTARRAIEFGLAIMTMLLISPHTAQDYLVTTLPVIAVWLWLWGRQLPRRWTVVDLVLGVAATFLLAVVVPMNLAARILPIGWLLGVTGNAHNALFVDQIGQAIGAYEFFGFPALGLGLGWLLLARFERGTK